MMKFPGFSLSAFVFITLLLSTQVSSRVMASAEMSYGANDKSQTSNCGVRSVINMARYLGQEINQTQVSELCRDYPQEIVNLQDVQQIAKRSGIQLEGVKSTLEELERRRQPFIAVTPNHFVFIERIDEQWVRYQEGSGYEVRSRADFEREFQGIALVLSSSFNALQISPSIVSWGTIPSGTPEKEATVTLTNVGKVPIAIRSITTSCSCTVPSQWPKEILPGQKVPLKVTIHLPGEGTFLQSVSIETDTAYPYQDISVFGRVESDIGLTPVRLHFGEVVFGTEVVRTLALRDTDHKLSLPLRISTTSPLITARIVSQKSDTFEIAATLHAPSRVQQIDESIIISGSGKTGRVVHVPMKGHIVPMSRISPEQVVFGSVSSTNATRVVRLFRQDKQPFEVLGVNGPEYLTYEFVPTRSKKDEWTLRIKILSVKAPAQVLTTVSVQIRKDNKIEDVLVPVSALIASTSTSSLETSGVNVPRKSGH
jgi:hypothetical protein